MIGFVGFGGFSVLFGVFFFAIFASIAAVIFTSIARSARAWRRDEHSPVLTVPAAVVAKRTDISGDYGYHHAPGPGHHYHHNGSSTTYFVTFEVESGDRMELRVGGEQYGTLVEDDVGKLTFQGMRFVGFERSRREGTETRLQ